MAKKGYLRPKTKAAIGLQLAIAHFAESKTKAPACRHMGTTAPGYIANCALPHLNTKGYIYNLSKKAKNVERYEI